MKTIKILFIIPLLFILIGIVGCGDKDNKENDEISTGLKGTSWKLAGFVDVKTGELIEAQPRDGKCYTIEFSTDTEGTARSVLDTIPIDLTKVPFIRGGTKVDDTMNGNVLLFYDAVLSIQSYTYEKDDLKFFYNEGGHYLCYKRIGP